MSREVLWPKLVTSLVLTVAFVGLVFTFAPVPERPVHAAGSSAAKTIQR